MRSPCALCLDFEAERSVECVRIAAYLVQVPLERSDSSSQTAGMRDWTFLTNHSHVLLCIAQNPQIRLSEIAERVGIKERTVFAIVSDLVREGYLSKVRNGRRNEYAIRRELPFRHPIERDAQIRALLAIFDH